MATAHNPDLILINETHLKPGLSIRLRNYKVVRSDGPTIPKATGSTAIFVKRHLPWHPKTTPKLESVQATVITLKFNSLPPIGIASCYHPPHRRNFFADYDNLANANHMMLLADNFNPKNTEWGCRVTNPKGRSLARLAQNRHLKIIAPEAPTHVWNRRADILDFAIFKNIPFAYELEVLPEAPSDHYPLLLTMSLDASVNINLPKFKKTLAQSELLVPSIKTKEDVHKEAEKLEDHPNCASPSG